MDILLPMMYSDSQDFLETNIESWQNAIDWISEQGLLEKSITAEEILANIE
ncbi:hypothetical protein IMSAG049_00762 [Clostridiales bacterium]|nr:hypothetical protein IMSAG049_00762 [Clostridiales bacterium]